MSTANYDLKQCLGFEYPPEDVIWNQRDTILYALSIGAHKDDFKLIYEKNPEFAVFPTFPTTLSFKGVETDVFDFASKFGSEPKPPGLPTFDTRTLVQASQFVEILRPIPKTGTSGWKVTKRVVGIHESSEGVTLDNEIVLVGPDGEKYTRMIAQARYLKGVANGVPFDETIAEGFPVNAPISSLGPPKWTTKGPTWPEQSVLYRLNGDYNPLHIDPAVGEQLGYGGLICHGLGMYSITARALLEKLSESDPSALKAISALFIGPLVPGDTLNISIWDVGPGPNGSTSIAFEARNSKGSLCLGEGRAYLIKKTVLPETGASPPHDPSSAVGLGP